LFVRRSLPSSTPRENGDGLRSALQRAQSAFPVIRETASRYPRREIASTRFADEIKRIGTNDESGLIADTGIYRAPRATSRVTLTIRLAAMK